MKSFIERFLKMEAAGGILLMLAAAVAMFMANNAWLSQAYFAFLDTPLQVRIAELDINKPLLLWINDGLMTIFFFLVGLELKREMLDGMGMRRVNVSEYLEEDFGEPVYCQIDASDYNKRKDGVRGNKADFFANPEQYKTNLVQLDEEAQELLINYKWPGNIRQLKNIFVTMMN